MMDPDRLQEEAGQSLSLLPRAASALSMASSTGPTDDASSVFYSVYASQTTHANDTATANVDAIPLRMSRMITESRSPTGTPTDNSMQASFRSVALGVANSHNSPSIAGGVTATLAPPPLIRTNSSTSSIGSTGNSNSNNIKRPDPFRHHTRSDALSPLSSMVSDVYAEDQPTMSVLEAQPSITDHLLHKSATLLAPGIPRDAEGTPASNPREHRDRPMAGLYVLCLLVLFVSGIVLLFTTQSSSLGRFISRSFYSGMRDSLSVLGGLLTGMCVVGAVWLFLLRHYVRWLVRAHVVLVPLLTMTVFAWMMAEAFVGTAALSQPPSVVMILLSIASLLVSIGYTHYIWKRWHYLNQSIVVIELSLDVLKANPDLLAVGVFLNSLYVAFTALWLVFFNRLLLWGGTLPIPGDDPTSWVPDTARSWTSFYYIVMFFWTAHLLNDLQRITTAHVVSQWYFTRLRNNGMQGGRAVPALVLASTRQLGTAATTALLVAGMRVARVISLIVSRVLRWPSAVVVVHGMQRWLVRSLINVSGWTPAYAGMSGLGFVDSTQQVARLFRRNLVRRLDTDTLVRTVLTLSSLSMAALSGLSAYAYAAQSLHTPHAAIIGTIGSSISFFVARFYTRILTAISDAIFLCWTVDLDQNVNRCPAAHQAFAMAERVQSTGQ